MSTNNHILCVFVCYAVFSNWCPTAESKQTHCEEIITDGWAALPYKTSPHFKGTGDPVFSLSAFSWWLLY